MDPATLYVTSSRNRASAMGGPTAVQDRRQDVRHDAADPSGGAPVLQSNAGRVSRADRKTRHNSRSLSCASQLGGAGILDRLAPGGDQEPTRCFLQTGL